MSTKPPLAFLIAPPLLAGSGTLTQSMAHPELLLAENCALLLAPVYALRAQGIKTEYNALDAHQFLHNFLNGSCGGTGPYLAGLQQMARHIYTQACQQNGKSHCLDATYRYYYILDELAETFPETPLIQIRINPITYLSATIRQECGGQPERLKSCDAPYRDLFDAYRHLAKAPEHFGSRFLAVSYTDLCRQPDTSRARVHHYLGLPPTPLPLDSLPLETDAQHLDYWQQSPFRQRFASMAREYLEYLGPELLVSQGYQFSELLTDLAQLAQPKTARESRP